MTESPEQEDLGERVLLTPEQAERVMISGEQVHSLMQAGFVLIGCDYGRALALEEIRKAVRLEVGGPSCRGMGHALVVWRSPEENVFLEHDEERLQELEAELPQAKQTQQEQPGSATMRALEQLNKSGDHSLEALTQAFADAGATVIVGDASGTRRVLPRSEGPPE